MKKLHVGVTVAALIMSAALLGDKNTPASRPLNFTDILTAHGAAADYFLKIDGVAGESTDDRHKGEIDIESFSWGMSNPSSASAGGGGTGKVSFSDINVTKMLDKSSPNLMFYAAQGRHIPKVIFSATKTTETGTVDYYTITLEDVLVTSFQQSGSTKKGADIVPMESVSFNFSKIMVEYKPQNPDGTLGAPVKFSWNVAENRVK